MPPQREWFEKDYYAVLGVAPDAAQKDVTKAYRKLARQHHPDANPGNKDAEERFKEVSAAYDVLGDAEKRKEYDQVRSMAASGFRGFGRPGFGGTRVRFGDVGGDFGDLFSNLFGGAPRGGRFGGGARVQRGADLQAAARLTFDEAMNGTTTTVKVDTDRRCSRCGGVGAEPGTSPKPCPECGGTGAVTLDQGPFSFSQPCPRCAGTGQIVESPCRQCGGRGVERARQDVKVRIPPGVLDGERIRVKDRGAHGPGGGPRGDLWVQVNVAGHPVYQRRGRYDLTLKLPVTFAEAALGAEVKVPTLEGPVTVRIPPGTPAGRTLRLKGKGASKPKGGRGDVMATVEVAVPRKLTREERELIEQLAALDGDHPRRHLEA